MPTFLNPLSRRTAQELIARGGHARASPGTSASAPGTTTAGLLLRDTTLYRNMVGITRGADSLMRIDRLEKV